MNRRNPDREPARQGFFFEFYEMLSVSFPLIPEKTFLEKGFLPEGTLIRDNVVAIGIPNVALGLPADSAFFPFEASAVSLRRDCSFCWRFFRLVISQRKTKACFLRHCLRDKAFPSCLDKARHILYHA